MTLLASLCTRSASARARLGLVVGLAGLAVVSAAPAFAALPDLSAAQCAQLSGRPAVRAVALQAADTITLVQQPYTEDYRGDGQMQVFCQAADGSNLGNVMGATVQITITPGSGSNLLQSDFSISGPGVPFPGTNPATIGSFDGTTTFTVYSPRRDLFWNPQPLAVHAEVLQATWSAPYTGTRALLGDIYAETPELGSVALFGSGALTALGYVLLRRRAARQ
jgi:hypothetical protein